MRRLFLGCLVTSALLCGVSTEPMQAQVRASERGTVSQTVDGTTITVDYSRPRARGRKGFGDEVKWGEVWTPGANQATTIEVSNNVQLDGHPLAKGKYSVWMEVKEHGDWTLIIDTMANRFHMNRPKPDSSQLRYAVHPQKTESTEALTWSFPAITATGTTLVMQWGRVRVPIRITVPPSHPIVFSPDSARRYLGEYIMISTDTVPDSSRYTVTYENGSLWGNWEDPPMPEMGHMLLIHTGDGVFLPALWKNGELYDVMDYVAMTFPGEGDQSSGFELRGDDDELWARGVRKH
jgi:hypothetical protein